MITVPDVNMVEICKAFMDPDFFDAPAPVNVLEGSNFRLFVYLNQHQAEIAASEHARLLGSAQRVSVVSFDGSPYNAVEIID